MVFANMEFYISLSLLFALRALADTILPTNNTAKSTDDQFTLQWNPGGSTLMKFPVEPLTIGDGLGAPQNTIQAEFINGTLVIPDNAGNGIRADQIAFLTCDNNTNDSDLTPSDIFGSIAEIKPRAIVLFSVVANGCSLAETSSYSSVFTMTESRYSIILSGLLAQNPSNPAPAQIGTPGTLNQSDGNATTTSSADGSSSSASADDSNNGATPAPTTAVAMSILYSITGIITLLFLIIIATGAVRAHRHPERYGPRNGFPGRPRQSRAKGLARAMLETLPIVKFGDSEAAKPARDLELDSANAQGAANNEPALAAGGREDGDTARDISAADQEGGLGPNQNPPAGSPEASRSGDGDLGCSICTEDFTRGEDVRVLPCNHKYHPACIDPWLLNVSGTCPLCRVDLRPVQSDSSRIPTAEDFEEPTVVTEATEADTAGLGNSTGPSNTRRRMSRLLDFNRLRHAEPAERIAALRHLRTQDRNEATAATPMHGDPTQEGGEAATTNDENENENGNENEGTPVVPGGREDRIRRSRFTRTIRAAFDIRTVASPAERAVPPAGDASMVGGRGA